MKLTAANRSAVRHLALLAGASLLAGCGGGGGGDASAQSPTPTPAPTPTPTPNNFAAKAVQVETADIRAGYPMKVAVTIAADRAAENVPVSIYAIEYTNDDNAEIDQIPLADHVIPQVEAGEHTYEIELTVPSNVPPESYHIAALVEPAEDRAETTRDDNAAAAVEAVATTPGPNILLSEMTLDRAALLINTDSNEDRAAREPGDVYNADAAGTITVGSDGLAPAQTVDIEAFATMRLHRTDLNTSHEVPLYLWNSALERYTNAFGVDPSNGGAATTVEWLPLGVFEPQLVDVVGEDVTLNDVKRNSAHISFYFPGNLGAEIERAMRYQVPPPGVFVANAPTFPPPNLSQQDINQLRAYLAGLPSSGWGDETAAMAVMEFSICTSIRLATPGLSDRTADDNRTCEPLALSLPPVAPVTPPTPPLGGYTPALTIPAKPIARDNGFTTKSGGSLFSFGMSFDATEAMDSLGYRHEISAAVPITIFGSKFNFTELSFAGSLVPDYAGKPASATSGWDMEIRFLNQVIASVPSSTVPISKDYTYSREAPAPALEREFFVGPIPLVAGAAVTGNLGIKVAVGHTFDDTATYPTAQYLFGGSVTPFVNSDLTMFAGIGNRLYSAGVEGVLQFFDEQMPFLTGIAISVRNNGLSNGNVEFVIKQGQEIRNVFKGPQGSINLYAKYSVPKVVTCNWGLFKGKCIKRKEKKVTKNLWRSPRLFVLNDVLWDNYDDNEQLGVVILGGGSPIYFRN